MSLAQNFKSGLYIQQYMLFISHRHFKLKMTEIEPISSTPFLSPILPKPSFSPTFPLLNNSTIIHPDRMWELSKVFFLASPFLLQSH